jgi:predicted transglutaminase-like cysteine proteinase
VIHLVPDTLISRIAHYLIIVIIICYSCLICIVGQASGKNLLDPSTHIENGRVQYEADKLLLLKAWVAIIHDDSNATDMEKLIKVNCFFNKMSFIEDEKNWGSKDYWATPVEFLRTSGGDCEDFALAKFFTLKAMGIDERKLFMTYAKTLSPRRAHMVVTYHPTQEDEPLILDNLSNEIKPAGKRADLLLVFSFNCSNYCMIRKQRPSNVIGKNERWERWRDVQHRMDKLSVTYSIN